MGKLFKVSILILLFFSAFHIHDFPPSLVENSSAYSTWVTTNETLAESAKLINCTANQFSNSNITLSLQNKHIADNFFSTYNLSYSENLVVDPLTGGIKPLMINTEFNMSDSDECYDMQPTADGGYILVGMARTIIRSSIDVWLIKTDMLGNMEWNKTFGGINYDVGYSVQQTTDGGYIIVGETNSFGAQGTNVWLIKTNERGKMQWNSVFGGSEYDTGYSVIQTQGGGYAFVGQTYSYGHGNSDVWLVKTYDNGELSWASTFGDIDYDYGLSIQQTTDYGYIVIGTKFSNYTYTDDVFLIKTDSYGRSQWNLTFGGMETEYGRSVQQTSDGGYILVGLSYQGYIQSYDVWVIKTDRNGNIEWQKSYGGVETDEGISGQETADGGFIIVGNTNSYGSGNDDIWVIKTNETGGLQWSETYGGVTFENGRAIHQTAEGGFIIGGTKYHYGPRGNDFWLLNIDKFGNKIPNAGFTSISQPAYDVAFSINSFQYNATILNGTGIHVQFSKNNLTWLNSKSTLNNSDRLFDGNNSIDLSSIAPNWSKIFYRINFTSNSSNVSTLNWLNLSYYRYYPMGNIKSQPFNSGDNIIWEAINWNSREPMGTVIRFQIRTANSKSNLSIKDYVGPEGSVNSFYNNSGDAIWSGHHHEQWIQYKAYLYTTIGNHTPILNNVTINYNRYPNAPILKSPNEDLWINNDAPIFTWVFDDPDSDMPYKFQWQADDVINFSSVKYDSNKITSSVESYTHSKILSDGIWYWRVRTQDHDGAWGPFSSNYTVKIDTSTPDIDHKAVTNGIAGKSITISAKVTDGHSGIQEVQLYFKGASESSYTVFTMKGTADVYSATIPSDFVKDKYIGYYILALDNSNPPNTIYFSTQGKTKTEPTPLFEIKIDISGSKQEETDDFQWSIILIVLVVIILIIIITLLIVRGRKKVKPTRKDHIKQKVREIKKPKEKTSQQKIETKKEKN